MRVEAKRRGEQRCVWLCSDIYEHSCDVVILDSVDAPYAHSRYAITAQDLLHNTSEANVDA